MSTNGPKHPGISVNPKTYAIIREVAKRNKTTLTQVVEYLVSKGVK